MILAHTYLFVFVVSEWNLITNNQCFFFRSFAWLHDDLSTTHVVWTRITAIASFWKEIKTEKTNRINIHSLQHLEKFISLPAANVDVDQCQKRIRIWKSFQRRSILRIKILLFRTFSLSYFSAINLLYRKFYNLVDSCETHKSSITADLRVRLCLRSELHHMNYSVLQTC